VVVPTTAEPPAPDVGRESPPHSVAKTAKIRARLAANLRYILG